MSKEIDAVKMPEFEKVFQTYTGRPGCMCGCLGKYSVKSNHRKFADKDRGYPHNDEDINDRSVKIIFNKIAKALKEGKKVTTSSRPFGYSTNYIAYQTETRNLVAYYIVD